MHIDLFTDNWQAPPTLHEGERLCHIITTNPADNLYAIWDTTRLSEVEFRIQVANDLFWRKRAVYEGFEDVTDLWYDEL